MTGQRSKNTREQMVYYRITDWEASERPRERLAEIGAQALSTAELLAILLRTGLPGENAVQLGQRLLNTFGGLRGLHRASFSEVCAQHGVGEAKAAQIKAAIELGKRLRDDDGEDDRRAIHSPADAADLVMYEMAGLVQENLWVILTDTRNRVMSIEKLYQGSLNASTVRVAELFRAAIIRTAASILVVHNHPSGDPTPSPEDIALTRAVVQAGRLLDIQVLDHLVIGRGRFVSLKERGLGFDGL
ncbi:DNA replication and repair protein RadC [Bellilinea caldifistulae]|nr:DNA repair protein RadC [Bellilinea caldifistulae]GAP10156.1 DNA replication and repair protein RadC [Bellilinea caldifistulae]